MGASFSSRDTEEFFFKAKEKRLAEEERRDDKCNLEV